MSIYYPGTTTLVTHSFDERILDAEFDDALVDQKAWKNSRYDGSRLKAKKANFFTESSSIWEGDSSYQNLAVLENQTTALYIANTVIGGTEDPQFATIKNHSYIGINKILLINTNDDSVQVLDRSSEPFQEFHRFITNDFPTGNKAKIKILDNSIATNLKGTHRVKMNKGYLLKTLSFHHAGESSGSLGSDPALTENNSMYLYQGGTFKDNFYKDGTAASSTNITLNSDQLRFRFGVLEIFEGASNGTGGKFNINKAGPSFASSSIFENKFTQQYYSGSYGLVNHVDFGDVDTKPIDEQLGVSGLGSSSRFIGLNTLDFLKANNNDSTLTTQEKTELHITFFEGTKDFGSGSFDERSIGTFEVDFNRNETEVGGRFHDFLPTNHELVLKGVSDNRFAPQTATVFADSFRNSYFTSPTSSLVEPDLSAHLPLSMSHFENVNTHGFLEPGANIDLINNLDIYVQGGALGPVGFNAALSSSNSSQGRVSLSGSMTEDNYYSGSFRYELSFLDKDHTLILNLDKDAELFDGIGSKGLALLPQNSSPQIKNNLEYYLEKAGIIESTTSTTQNINPSAQSNLQQF